MKLSSRVGEDTLALKVSYRELIHEHFDALRADRQRYLDKEWAPRYISGWVRAGRLVDVARGEVVWSRTKEDFVAPGSADADSNLLQTVGFWSKTAIDDLQAKRKELMDPLDAQEKELQAAVDSAFDQVSRGNAMITAHLNSLRKVQAVQDELLEALDIKDLRDRINKTVVSLSNQADDALNKVRQADGFVDQATSIVRPAAPQPQPITQRESSNGQ